MSFPVSPLPSPVPPPLPLSQAQPLMDNRFANIAKKNLPKTPEIEQEEIKEKSADSLLSHVEKGVSALLTGKVRQLSDLERNLLVNLDKDFKNPEAREILKNKVIKAFNSNSHSNPLNFSDGKPRTLLYRGCDPIQLVLMIKGGSAGGLPANPNASRPSEDQVKDQVGLEGSKVGCNFPEFSRDKTIASSFSSGGFLIEVMIRSDLLTRGSGIEKGMVALHDAPIEFTSIKRNSLQLKSVIVSETKLELLNKANKKAQQVREELLKNRESMPPPPLPSSPSSPSPSSPSSPTAASSPTSSQKKLRPRTPTSPTSPPLK